MAAGFNLYIFVLFCNLMSHCSLSSGLIVENCSIGLSFVRGKGNVAVDCNNWSSGILCVRVPVYDGWTTVNSSSRDLNDISSFYRGCSYPFVSQTLVGDSRRNVHVVLSPT